MILISYDEIRQFCVIESDDIKWDSIKVLFAELSSESTVSSNQVLIPWYSFISNLRSVNYIANQYKVQVEFTKEARELLSISLNRRNSFINSATSKVASEAEVQAKLDALGFKRTLKSYQLKNVAKLLRLHAGATFSVPGAGKTTEAIAYYLLKRTTQKLLVICPKVAFPAWEEQFMDCFEEQRFSILRLTGGRENIKKSLLLDRDVFLLTYDQFILVADLISRFLSSIEAFLFLDESHRIKGGDRSRRGQEIQLISHLPVGKLIMSGTPMPNSPSDLVPQFKFLFPEVEDVDDDSVIDKIQGIYVRTTKQELGLKDPITKIVSIPFNEPQRSLYDLARKEELRKAQSLSRYDKAYLRTLGRSYMRLLQIVSNPALLIKNNHSYPDLLREVIEYGDSSKIEYVVKRTRQLVNKGKKVLIWSGFVENVELISRKLADLGADYLHGGVEAGSEDEENTREQKVKRFHDDSKAMVLVANPAACSEGISLHTACNYAIYVDRNYNAAQYLQSKDRIHRLGLKPNTDTTYEILHTPDSIDVEIHSRLEAKVRRMADVLNDPSLHTEAEFAELDDLGFNFDDAEAFIKHLKSN
ncbi:DEAD/DEAH box helicase [Sabulibacter ruber]|uniref:DEAD/DEAH box helicase n=1 Tax=Sabulibacter ruber TaxID=2811901 RepID=UPI001A96CC31|nr:DEAD/DEAH box helicase [Sabulibacter ruber]